MKKTTAMNDLNRDLNSAESNQSAPAKPTQTRRKTMKKPSLKKEITRIKKRMLLIGECKTIIKKNMHQTIIAMVASGKDLCRCKEVVGHGNFENWLTKHFEKEFDLNMRTARNHMTLYKRTIATINPLTVDEICKLVTADHVPLRFLYRVPESSNGETSHEIVVAYRQVKAAKEKSKEKHEPLSKVLTTDLMTKLETLRSSSKESLHDVLAQAIDLLEKQRIQSASKDVPPSPRPDFRLRRKSSSDSNKK
ncbi:MAG: hypothetical protein WA705_12160 [Candidatus Ozemobacteraceae bacterium]